MRTCCASDDHKPHLETCRHHPGKVTKEVNIASFGFGRQSTAMGELSDQGEIVPLDAGIFADPMCERPETYEYKEKCEKRWGIKVITVSKGNLEADLLGARAKHGYQRVNIPAWTLDDEGKRSVPFSRVCTVDYKIKEVQKAARALIGFTDKPVKGVQVNMLIGMSVEETHRMTDSREYWIKNKYPLITDKPMSAQRCTDYLVEKGLGKPPKSACFFCPYSSNANWRSLKNEHPDLWKRAVHLDEAIRTSEKAEHPLYLHQSRVPLEKVNLDEKEDSQLDLFGNECLGMCGT